MIGYAHWVLRQTGAESANEPTPSAEYQAIEAEDRATMHPRAPELTAKRRALHRASEEREMGPDSRNKGKQYYHLVSVIIARLQKRVRAPGLQVCLVGRPGFYSKPC